jgi:hypothetical protein
MNLASDDAEGQARLAAFQYKANPVILPPGRAKVSTKPLLTGSTTVTNTIDTVRVACCNAATLGLPADRMTSGASTLNSAANLRIQHQRKMASAA